MANDRTSSLVLFLAGLAAGAALGVLLAPRSGAETRSKLAAKGRHAKDRLDDLIDEGHEQWTEAKGKATDAANMTKEEVDDFVRFLFSEGKELWDRVVDSGREAKTHQRTNGA